jgi:hypothetical protein
LKKGINSRAKNKSVQNKYEYKKVRYNFPNQTMDYNNNGQIDAGDFRQFGQQQAGLPGMMAGQMVFSQLDANHDGKLSASDAMLLASGQQQQQQNGGGMQDMMGMMGGQQMGGYAQQMGGYGQQMGGYGQQMGGYGQQGGYGGGYY